MTTVDVLIFDIDGVLVDVSRSYREAIRRVPQVFFEAVCRFEPMEGELVSPEVVEAFKLARGLNNDWDCTAAVTAAFAAVFSQPLPPPPSSGGMEAYLEVLGDWGPRQGLAVKDIAARADPVGLAEQVSAAGGGGLASALAAAGFAEKLFPIAFGSLIESNVIMRLFQEMYLGPELFEGMCGGPPLVMTEPGLIEREELLIDRTVLEELASRVPLGIATGRPRAEAAHALGQHSIDRLFAAVVDDEDVRQAEADELSRRGTPVRLGKPHPWSLLEAVRRVNKKALLAAYVGDTPDDVRAAKAANATMPFLAIGTAQRSDEFKRALALFREVGADIVLGHPDGLRLLDIWGSIEEGGSEKEGR